MVTVNIQEMLTDISDDTSGGGTRGLYQDIVCGRDVIVGGQRRVLDRIDLMGGVQESVIDIGCNIGSF